MLTDAQLALTVLARFRLRKTAADNRTAIADGLLQSAKRIRAAAQEAARRVDPSHVRAWFDEKWWIVAGEKPVLAAARGAIGYALAYASTLEGYAYLLKGKYQLAREAFAQVEPSLQEFRKAQAITSGLERGWGLLSTSVSSPMANALKDMVNALRTETTNVRQIIETNNVMEVPAMRQLHALSQSVGERASQEYGKNPARAGIFFGSGYTTVGSDAFDRLRLPNISAIEERAKEMKERRKNFLNTPAGGLPFGDNPFEPPSGPTPPPPPPQPAPVQQYPPFGPPIPPAGLPFNPFRR